MKKFIYLPAIIFFFFFLAFSSAVFAQLTEQQKAAMNIYIKNTPSLSKYGNTIAEKALMNEEVIAEIKNCWRDIKKYSDLETVKTIEDLTEMYSQLGQRVPELRNKFLPDFVRDEYKYAMVIIPGNTVSIDAKVHSVLLNHYYSGRKDKLNLENAFGSMIIQYPELVENLRKAASTAMGKEANDKILNFWLEMNYYQNMRLNALNQIIAEEKDVHSHLNDICLAYLPNRFAEVAKANSTPQNWVGVFANENLTVKFQESRGYIFGTSDVNIGSASESLQWNLSVTGGDAEGDWIVATENNDMTMKKSGTITVKLDGDIMKFLLILDKTEVVWKANVTHYDVPLLPKGTKMDGTLTRKK